MGYISMHSGFFCTQGQTYMLCTCSACQRHKRQPIYDEVPSGPNLSSKLKTHEQTTLETQDPNAVDCWLALRVLEPSP